MAFVQGQLITATELNAVNGAVYIGFPTTANNNTYYKPTSTGFYYHGSTGVVFRYNVGNGWFSNPTMSLEKLINGSWSTVYSKSNGGWSTKWGDTVRMENTNNPGPGWYRIKFVTSWSGSSDWGYYPSQKDCKRGDYLIYYDAPTSSGNRIPNTLLTVANLNSGRCGTQAIL